MIGVTAQEDAAILRGLERAGFPAERCAHPEPVSEFLGQSVLVTDFLEDHGRPCVLEMHPQRGHITVLSDPRAVAQIRGFLDHAKTETSAAP